MTTQEAKKILTLYRPGTADAEDTAFAEALQHCEQDPALKQWFNDHCAVYSVLRSKLKGIESPEGFKEQILAERKVNAPGFWARQPVRSTAVLVAIFAVVFILVLRLWAPAENTGFTGFRDRMISKALRSYGMDLETDNLQRVRELFAERKSISDFALPQGLEKAKLIGCLATTWQGQPVSILCFRTGKRLPAGRTSDLWLFVTNTSSVPGAPKNSQPTLQKTKDAAVAIWHEAEKTYVLAIDGDEAALSNYL